MPNSNSIFRNVNILYEFNASNSTEVIDLYQPGFLNPYDMVNGAKYSGFITSLRLTIDITSIPELSIVETGLLDGDTTKANNAKETFNGNYKKCLSFFMRTASYPITKVIDIYLFNQRPHYYIDLLPYFTSANTLDIAPDTVISCQISDKGNGLLEYEDRVLVLGSVVEEAPQFNQELLGVD